MADYDRDGCLDVYVVNYVRFSYETHQTCRRGRIVGYCHPDVYPGVPDVLYRGRCDGRFTDVSDATGIANRDPAQSKGLGVAWTDYDGDGDVDVYVANDSTRNFLYRNDGARFTDVAIEAGAAYNDLGATEAGMGVAPGDYDGDGDVDVFVTHLDFETNTLYQNRGDGSFFDATTLAGLAGPSVTRVGFGAAWADFDLDGDLDLFVANGHILDNIAEDNSSLGYAQANQVFENDGGRLRDVTIQVGDAVGRPSVSRAAAVGDYDNDGDLDVLVVNSGGPAQLLRNETQRPRRGVSVRLVTRGRDAIGARARLIRGGGPSPVAEIYAGSSYLAQRDPRLVFGLPDDAPGWRIEIRWPDGAAQTVDGASLKLGAVTEIRQGEAAR
jgi:hypothetical protein